MGLGWLSLALKVFGEHTVCWGWQRSMTEWETSFPIPSSDSLLSHVEQLLRAFILKISVCDAVLDHNPPGVMPRSPSVSLVTAACLSSS